MAKTAKMTLLLAASLIFAASIISAESSKERVTFTKDIAPIFQQKCESCHRPSAVHPDDVAVCAYHCRHVRSLSLIKYMKWLPVCQGNTGNNFTYLRGGA